MSLKPKTNSERVNVFLSSEVLTALKAKAETKGTSVSGLIRMIVMEYINKQK